MYEELERGLGYHFQNQALLENALTHSSYANERRDGRSSNERLEFLGNSILGFVVADACTAACLTARRATSRESVPIWCVSAAWPRRQPASDWESFSSWDTERSRAADATATALWPMRWNPSWQRPTWTAALKPPRGSSSA